MTESDLWTVIPRMMTTSPKCDLFKNKHHSTNLVAPLCVGLLIHTDDHELELPPDPSLLVGKEKGEAIRAKDGSPFFPTCCCCKRRRVHFFHSFLEHEL